MSEQFDPYLHWLGIRDPQRPPNYYRLLGIELFESDPEVISNAADRQMAHVRTFQTGKHSALSQKILNELAAAKLCLLNPEKKAQYDAQLLAQQAAQQYIPPLSAAPPGQPPPGGLWPLNPPPVPPPSGETSPAEAASDIRPETSSWFSIVATGLVAVILVLVAAIVVVGVKKSTDHVASPSPKSSRAPEEPSLPPPGLEDSSPGASQRSQPSAKPSGTTGPNTSEEKVSPSSSEAKENPPGAPSGPTTQSPPSPSLEETVRAVRQALAQRDLETARKYLELANRTVPMGSPEAERVGSLDKVCMATEEFWKAVSRSLPQLRPGDQLDLGRAKPPGLIKAVEGDCVKVEIEGQMHTWSLKDMPIDLAMALAQRTLPPTADSLLARAAALIFDPAGDLAEAHRLIQEALSKKVPHAPELAEELKLAQSSRLARSEKIPSEKMAEEKPEGAGPEGKPPVSTPAPISEPPPKPSRFPVPSPEAQQKAIEKIQEIFAQEYKQAQKLPEKAELARNLYRVGSETRDDPAAQYMLFVEARNLALEGADPRTLDRSLRRIAQNFEVDLIEQSAAFFEESAKRSRPAPANQAAAQVALDFAEEAFARDKLPEAVRLAQAALEMARKASDSAKIKKAVAFRRRYEEFLPRYQAFLEAEKTLRTNPQDPEANLAYGFYLCFAKQEWTAGLRYLAKGSDPVLKELAEAELKLTGPKDPTRLVELADKWWEAATPLNNEALKEVYRARAGYWYRQAYQRTTGFTRTRIERRLQELQQ